MLHRFIQKLNCLALVWLGRRAETCREEKGPRPAVKVESRQICRRRLLNGFLLVRRQLRLQLIGDGFGDFALDGEDISQVAIVGLCPQMRVGSRVYQLRIYPNFVGSTLHAAFDDMSHAKLPSDFAQIARCAAFVCMTLVRLITFKSAIFAR